MPQILKVKFGNGSIAYRHKIEETPATSETTGNVTINDAGSPGRPSHFDTSFMLAVEGEEGGLKFSNVFHWNGIVISENQQAPYREIEDAAARQLAPALRAVADLIEQDIQRYEKDLERPPQV